MNMRITFEKLWAFFCRDLAIARGYRSAFILEACEALFGVATFYYLSRFVESPQLSSALPQGGSYFAFALIGFAFFDYLSVAFNAFDSSLEEARQNRTLEALLVTQTSLPVMLARFGDLSVCSDFPAHCGVPRMGRALIRVFTPLSKLAWRNTHSAGLNPCVCRPGNFLDQLHSAIQARQSREMDPSGTFWIPRRDDVSGFDFAEVLAGCGAIDPDHVFVGRNARRVAGRSAFSPAVAFDYCFANLCGNFTAAVLFHICVGTPPDKNHRNSHAYLAMNEKRLAPRNVVSRRNDIAKWHRASQHHRAK